MNLNLRAHLDAADELAGDGGPIAVGLAQAHALIAIAGYLQQIDQKLRYISPARPPIPAEVLERG